MRAVTVYRLDDSSNFSYHTRHPIGSVLELRTYERGNNYKDLLRLARRLFALDTADAVHGPHRCGSRPAGISPGDEQGVFGGVVSKMPLLCECLSLDHGRR